MNDKKTLKDYIIGLIAILIIIVPEAIKICAIVVYTMVLWFLSHLDTSTLNQTQATFTGLAFLIAPIGIYYFYEKSLLKPGYDKLVDIIVNMSKEKWGVV